MIADDGGRMDFRRSLDCLTMFLIPAHDLTKEEKKQQEKAYEEAAHPIGM